MVRQQPLTVHGAQQGPADASRRLEAMLRGLTSPGVPGAVAVVLQGERAVAQAAVGVADLATNEPATMSTPYLWFSLTKIATATAVMQLADKDLLRLDDAVSRYVPEFPRPRRSWPAVTIKHLLSHSSGLANPLPLRWVHAADDAPRETAAFTSDLLRRHGRLRFPAGQRASYSNLGYLALGEVVASVAARPYVDYVAAEILAPLGMSHTGFRYPGPESPAAATGYHPRCSPITPLLRLALPRGLIAGRQGRFLALAPFCVDGPSYGGLIGPATDAARLMAAHLAGGHFGSFRLLSDTGVTEMQQLRAHGRRLDVGLGWFRQTRERGDAEPFVEHLGGGAGYFSMMRLYPRRGVGILTMGNATRYDHAAIATRAAALAA